MRENHLGVVWLSQPPELALATTDHPTPGPLWLGRAGGKPTPGLCLDFLDQPGSLLWSKPGLTSGSLGQFELSRQQLEAVLNPGADQLEVTPPASGSGAPSFVLDRGFRLLTTLKPGDATWHLELGQYLLLGCYLLRFERVVSDAETLGEEKIFAVSSAGAEDDRILTDPPSSSAE